MTLEHGEAPFKKGVAWFFVQLFSFELERCSAAHFKIFFGRPLGPSHRQVNSILEFCTFIRSLQLASCNKVEQTETFASLARRSGSGRD